MPLAQLTASQIPYDRLDWLQIAVYFVALPLLAFTGALLALLGRTRRGGVLWSTNVGLLGGAVACLIIAASFWTFDATILLHLLDDYEQIYRWQMVIVAIGSTFLCSLGAGVAWRWMHPPKEVRPVSFSLKQLLMVQCLTLVSLGSWVSLRQFMLNATDQEAHWVQHWAKRHWYVSTDGKEIRLDHRLLTPEEHQAATSYATLRELSYTMHEVERLSLSTESADGHRLGALFNRGNLKELTLGVIDPAPNLLNEIGESNLNRLLLLGETGGIDLAPLANAAYLNSLTISGPLRRTSIQALNESPVHELEIYECKIAPTKKPIEKWPWRLSGLYVWGGTNLKSEDFDSIATCLRLDKLRISDIPLDANALSAISSLPYLKTLQLSLGKLDQAGHRALQKLKAEQITLDVKNLNLAQGDLASLPNVKNLKRLTLECFPARPDIAEILAKCSDVEVLVLDIDGLPVNEVLKLAAMKNLRRLHYHGRLAGQNFETPFHAQREKQRLPYVELRPLPMLASAVGSPPSPNATSKPYTIDP